MRLGQYIERADATARLLDVKYHVLLPKGAEVGGTLDHVQWVQILRAANSQRAYRHVYRQAVSPDLVTDFLILNPMSPRSLLHSYSMLVRHLDAMAKRAGGRRNCHAMARRMLSRLMDVDVNDIFTEGLHEFLTEFIQSNSALAQAIAKDHGFGPEAVAA